jgi:Yip1 domain
MGIHRLADGNCGDVIHPRTMKTSELESPVQNTLAQQAIGIMRLDVPTYRSVVEDRTTFAYAVAVVLIASGLSAIGLMFGSEGRLQGAVKGVLAVVVGWIVAALAITLFARLLARREVEFLTALRLTGFTSVFAFGGVFGLIPGVGIIGVAAGALLAPVGNTLGIREAIRVSKKKALLIAVLAAFADVGVAEILDRALSPIFS